MRAKAQLRYLPADVGGPPSWGEVYREFLEDLELRRYSAHTITWYRCILQPFGRFMKESCGTEDPSAVEEEDVRAFLRAMADEGAGGRRPVGARRLNHYREGLRRLYDWLEERGYAQHNPAAKIGKVREPKRLIAALTGDQVTALLAQPDRGLFVGLRDFCFILTLLDTGIRLSEGLGLQLARVDMEDGVARIIGKGDKEREIGFSARLMAELRTYAIKREAALEHIGRPDSQWLFPNDAGGRLSAKAVQRRVRGYGEQAGIRGVRVSPHTLRHTYALNFVRAGGDPFTLQKVLGHTSLATTRRYCELASGDVLRRQRELSPLHTMDLRIKPGRRVPRRDMERW